MNAKEDNSYLADDLEILMEFVHESLQALETADEMLRKLAENPENRDVVNAIFRPIHSVKGNSAFLGLLKLRLLAHETESLLDDVRQNKLFPGPAHIDLVRAGVDLIKNILIRVDKEGCESVDGKVLDSMVQALRNRDGNPVTAAAGTLPESSAGPSLPRECDATAGSKRSDQKKSATVFFQKARLIVQETVRQTGKKARLLLQGEQSGIPPALASALGSPMMHVLRNAVDHGIEMPSARVRLGKPEEGTITLRVENDGRQLCFSIADDGAGLDLKQIMLKAWNAGIVARGKPMTPQQVAQLIFHPGLSTAKNISDISGRGVGMDVVKETVEQLGGTVYVKTRKSKGTEMILRLPCASGA